MEPFAAKYIYRDTGLTGDPSFEIEYAPTGRAACKKCYTKIGDKELRIGWWPIGDFHDDDDQCKGAWAVRWHHVNCFFERY